MSANLADRSPRSLGPKFEPSKTYLNYVLAMLALVSFFNYLDRIAISMLVTPIREELGFSDTQMGLLMGFAFAAFYATFGLPIARLADTRSRVTVLSICMVIWSAMTAACGLVQNFVQMLLARMGVGVGEAGCVPSSHSLLADYVPAERRAYALGLFQTGGALGTMVGLMAGGWIADQYGWRAAFFLLGIPGILVAIVVKCTVKDPPRNNYAAAPEPEPQPFGEAFRSLLGRPAYVQILIAYSMGLFAIYGVLTWTPEFFVRVHEMSLTKVGWWVGLTTGLGGVLGTFAGSLMAPRYIARDRRWEVWWPAWAYLICIPINAAAFLTGHMPTAFALLFIASVVAGTSIGPGMASVQSMAEPHQRATAVAILMFTSALIGQGAGPLVIGWASDMLSPSLGADGLRWAIVLSLAVFAWSWVHFMLAARNMSRDRVF